MIQAVITYFIVALAAAWLVWTLFLPEVLRRKLRPVAARGPSDCADGCAGCSGCPPATPPNAWQPIEIHHRKPRPTARKR
jgi:hypothetical protein